MLVCLSAAIARASRVKRSVNWAFETLIATSRFNRELWANIPRPSRLTDGRKDLVRAEFVADRVRHVRDSVK